MAYKDKNNEEYYTIDVLHIIKSLWARLWLIVLCGLLAAGIGFSISSFAIAPTYSSYVKLYVNNSSISLGNTNFSISASELTAAQGLVKTYGEILGSRSTLERVIEKAKVDYTWKELARMIVYAPSNDTEIMLVTVTCGNPYEASKIANTIAAARCSVWITAAAIPISEQIRKNPFPKNFSQIRIGGCAL